MKCSRRGLVNMANHLHRMRARKIALVRSPAIGRVITLFKSTSAAGGDPAFMKTAEFKKRYAEFRKGCTEMSIAKVNQKLDAFWKNAAMREVKKLAQGAGRARTPAEEREAERILAEIRGLVNEQQVLLQGSDDRVVREEVLVRVLGSAAGAALADELRAITAPGKRDRSTNPLNRTADTAQRMRKSLFSADVVSKSAGQSLSELCESEHRQAVLTALAKDPLKDPKIASAEFLKGARGSIVYGLSVGIYKSLPATEALERLAEANPDHCEQLVMQAERGY